MVFLPGWQMFLTDTKTTTLSFAPRLLAPCLLPLRKKLVELANQSLDHKLYVDTVVGIYFDHKSLLHPLQSFLIFDFYRVFLYENAASPDGPKVDSVVRYLCDDYFIDPKILAGPNHEQFQFFHSLEVLEILSLLWTDQYPGMMTTIDLSTGEIRKATALV